MGSRRTRTWPSSSPRIEPTCSNQLWPLVRGGWIRRGARATRRRGLPAARDLYGRDLDLRLDGLNAIVARTEGVTAAFIKELMRKAAVLAAADGDGAGPIRVTDANVDRALDELLAEGSRLTRILLGGDEAPPPARRGTSWMIETRDRSERVSRTPASDVAPANSSWRWVSLRPAAPPRFGPRSGPRSGRRPGPPRGSVPRTSNRGT